MPSSEDCYKALKHNWFSSFSFYVALTLLTIEDNAKRCYANHNKSISGGKHFLKIIPPEFYIAYKLLKETTTEPFSSIRILVIYSF